MSRWASVLPALMLTLLLLAPPNVAAAEQTLSQGASLVFELKGNPSTGYVWRLNQVGSENLAIVKVDDLGYGESKRGEGGRAIVGAPASYRFRITGVAPGSARLRFDYVRPWVGAAIKTKDLRVRVK